MVHVLNIGDLDLSRYLLSFPICLPRDLATSCLLLFYYLHFFVLADSEDAFLSTKMIQKKPLRTKPFWPLLSTRTVQTPHRTRTALSSSFHPSSLYFSWLCLPTHTLETWSCVLASGSFHACLPFYLLFPFALIFFLIFDYYREVQLILLILIQISPLQGRCPTTVHLFHFCVALFFKSVLLMVATVTRRGWSLLWALSKAVTQKGWQNPGGPWRLREHCCTSGGQKPISPAVKGLKRSPLQQPWKGKFKTPLHISSWLFLSFEAPSYTTVFLLHGEVKLMPVGSLK